MGFNTRTTNFHKKSLAILEHVQKIISEYSVRLTVRQIFYRLVSVGAVVNNLAQYKKVSKLLTDARYAGMISWESIEDSGRQAFISSTYPNIKEFVSDYLSVYRRDIWEDSPYYLEIWVEKNTLTNLFRQVTDEYRICLNVNKGFASSSSTWESIKRFKNHPDKKKIILYFGDYDPSGLFMHTDIQNRLGEFGVDVEVKRVSLNIDHVQKFNLPPAFEVISKKQDGSEYDKLKADPRAAGFIAENNGNLFQVEIDALDPKILLAMLKIEIQQYCDIDAMNEVLELEYEERESFRGQL